MADSRQKQAQQLLGWELSFTRQHLEDPLVSTFRYQGSGLSAINLSYQRLAPKSIWYLHLHYDFTRPGRDAEDNNPVPERVETSSWAMSMGWHRLVSNADKPTQVYIGLANHLQASISNVSVPIFNGNGLTVNDSYQFSLLDLAPGIVISRPWGASLLLMQLHYTLLYYGSRQNSASVSGSFGELPYFFDLASDYQHLRFSLRGFLPIGSRWQLSPALRLNYVNYRAPITFKQLSQQISMGLQYQL